MKRLFALLLAALLLMPVAALGGALPMDFSPAPAANESSYLSDTEYKDDTLHVTIEDIEQDNSVYHVARIQIADPSQLRTALSCDPGEKVKAVPSVIANAYNAVVAINGDSYLFRDKGYIVRQGQVLRKSGSTDLDMLLIDTAGDFHAIRKPTKASVTEALKSYDISQSIVFGPVLVMDGQAQTVYNSYGFAAQDKSPRSAIGQVGPLSYVLVVVDGRQEQSRGVTHKQLAEFMAGLGCTVAFNLDGGGSSTLVFHGKVFNSLSEGSEREISDIIYFATGRKRRLTVSHAFLDGYPCSVEGRKPFVFRRCWREACGLLFTCFSSGVRRCAGCIAAGGCRDGRGIHGGFTSAVGQQPRLRTEPRGLYRGGLLR